MQEMDEQIQSLARQCDRYELFFKCTYKWLTLLENGTTLIPYFEKHRCKKIGIYGSAEFGKMLCKELTAHSQIQVEFFMDRNAENERMIEGIPVFLPKELPNVPDVDMLVVTAIAAADSIVRTLLEVRPELPIVSLNTIIDARINEEWL